MRIAIFGASGRLAKEFIKCAKESKNREYEIFQYTRNHIDISKEEEVKGAFFESKPNVVLNFAAYTDVDGAETPDGNTKAIYANIEGANIIAKYCNIFNVKLCHISTSFVFDGELASNLSYTEESKTNPINNYGVTKLLGEEAIKSQMNNYFIIRTNWLFGSENDFLTKMISIAKRSGKISAINNHRGSFTSIKDLARFCLDLIDTNKFGVYNYVNSNFTTPFEFINEALSYLNISAKVTPISDSNFNFIAKRQKNLCLNTNKALSEGFDIKDWKSSLQIFLEEFYNDEEKLN